MDKWFKFPARKALPVVAGILFFCLSAAAVAFGFEDVAQRARQLAASSYKKPVDMPKELSGLNYDQYRDIRFKPERSLWRSAKLPFELAFFHRGLYFDQPIKINEVSSAGVREVRFNPEDFNYGANKLDTQKFKDIGFAGFRVHYPINTPKYKDEVLVFLGASYFRAVGRNQHYGLSARGLAIDTAVASGEEFPRFVEFWVERPSPKDTELVIYGLLDSRSAAGAYRFVVRPGGETVVDVKARVFARNEVAKLGLAPLTSMFFFGDNQAPPAPDYRPEVHDSDGLSIHSSTGEWLWRPLVNPKRLLVTSFALTDPQGFGLMQRDRRFVSYEDLEARYESRPSAWVKPRGKWGAGRVELVQIPTPDETNDNIVAFWVPAKPPGPKQALDIEYQLSWQSTASAMPPGSWVSQTRWGRGHTPKPDNSVTLHVDFDGPALKKIADSVEVKALVSVDANGELLENVARRNEVTGGWRLTVRFRQRDTAKPVELRAQLRDGNESISETWSYILPPT